MCNELRISHLNPNKGSPEWVRQYNEGLEMVSFAMRVARKQHLAGRYFIFEHPHKAASWREPVVQRMWELPGVTRVKVDMCAYGLKTPGPSGEMAAQKPTYLLTNMPAMAEGMNRKCRGDHEHQQLISSRAKKAEEYTPAFCRALVKCTEIQWKLDQCGQTTLDELNLVDLVNICSNEYKRLKGFSN